MKENTNKEIEQDEPVVQEVKRTQGELLESSLPLWQQKLNLLCENWIFAFLIAMIIRGFFIEAYRIPSASMEPMLYGDPALMKGDFVVVNKLFHRFSKPDRWSVTVFQYPHPEIMNDRGGVNEVWDMNGKRRKKTNGTPLIHRNFVKRCVVLPGDEFFVSGGDLYLKNDKGEFIAAEKPDDVQEALWTKIYEHGKDKGYIPWKGKVPKKNAIAVGEDNLTFSLSSNDEIVFTQPLNNLYLKEGVAAVKPTHASGSGEQVSVSMTSPLFDYNKDGKKEGNIWDLQKWEVSRLTTADLDSGHYGTKLNDRMTEGVGDVRLRMGIKSISGKIDVKLEELGIQLFILSLSKDSWSIKQGDTVLEKGSFAVDHSLVDLVHVDNRLFVCIDEEMVSKKIITMPSNPTNNRTVISLLGNGKLDLSSLVLERDVHYCNNGFLADEKKAYKQMRKYVDTSAGDIITDIKVLEDYEKNIRCTKDVREQMRGESFDFYSSKAYKPYGYNKETAIKAPDDAYLFLGDNSPHSLDSRNWGWVPASNIRGEVIAVAFPPWRWKTVK